MQHVAALFGLKIGMFLYKMNQIVSKFIHNGKSVV